MGKDLKGVNRGTCRLCKEQGDDCDEYFLPSNAVSLQITACRDCNHPPATHKKVESQELEESQIVETSKASNSAPLVFTPSSSFSKTSDNIEDSNSVKKADNEPWMISALGYVKDRDLTVDVLNASSSLTKNQVVKELFHSKFKGRWNTKNPRDCREFKDKYVMPEYKRRLELKKSVIALNSSAQFMMTDNPNAFGYFAQEGFVMQAHHRENFNKQLKSMDNVLISVNEIRKELKTHEENNSVDLGGGNTRPKYGLEPVLEFNNLMNTELLNIEYNLFELDTKLQPVRRKFNKDFPVVVPKFRDDARSKKENNRKSKKRKHDQHLEREEIVEDDTEDLTEDNIVVLVDSNDNDTGTGTDEGHATIEIVEEVIENLIDSIIRRNRITQLLRKFQYSSQS